LNKFCKSIMSTLKALIENLLSTILSGIKDKLH
jgi:hypothetical protein